YRNVLPATVVVILCSINLIIFYNVIVEFRIHIEDWSSGKECLDLAKNRNKCIDYIQSLDFMPALAGDRYLTVCTYPFIYHPVPATEGVVSPMKIIASEFYLTRCIELITSPYYYRMRYESASLVYAIIVFFGMVCNIGLWHVIKIYEF